MDFTFLNRKIRHNINYCIYSCYYYSIAIVKYLCMKYNLPDHWYPSEVRKRALVEQYLSWHPGNIRSNAFYLKVYVYIYVFIFVYRIDCGLGDQMSIRIICLQEKCAWGDTFPIIPDRIYCLHAPCRIRCPPYTIADHCVISTPSCILEFYLFYLYICMHPFNRSTFW